MSQGAIEDGVQECKPSGLTPAEDQELRQLIWFCRLGDLSDASTARLVDLIRRDRRLEVRNPRSDPSAHPDDGPSGARPKFEQDRYITVICRNCGAAVPLEDRGH